MSEVRRQSSASLATMVPCNAHQITGLKAGETLQMGEFVYIKKSDQKVWRANGTTHGSNAEDACGVAAGAAPADEAVTIHHGLRYRWTVSGTPAAGTLLYLSGANPGELATTAADTGNLPVARVVDDQGRIQLIGSAG